MQSTGRAGGGLAVWVGWGWGWEQCQEGEDRRQHVQLHAWQHACSL